MRILHLFFYVIAAAMILQPILGSSIGNIALSVPTGSVFSNLSGVAVASTLDRSEISRNKQIAIPAAEGFHEHFPASQMRSKRRRFPGFESVIIRRARG
jgi:hypothetical protein